LHPRNQWEVMEAMLGGFIAFVITASVVVYSKTASDEDRELVAALLERWQGSPPTFIAREDLR
jgi:hypothetical protein